MTAPIPNSLPDLIRIAESQFAVLSRSHDSLRLPYLRDNVTIHTFQQADNDHHLHDDTFNDLRVWFERQGWLVSRQRLQKPPYDGAEYVVIAPIEMLNPSLVYHATRTASLESIEKHGLCPSTRERCNSERLDSIGNIYAASELGSAGDESPANRGTAYWWREYLSHENRFNDRAWSILQINVAAISGLTCFRDIWSHTGIVIRANAPINGRHLKTVA